ncbi:MAG: DMT family transporter [Actinomycetota bacterium]|nr:DMT family transporter [Actinomycetota bacterium]
MTTTERDLPPEPAPASTPAAVAREWSTIILPGLIWGSSYLFIAESLEAIRPEGVTFVRTLIGFAVLSCFPGGRAAIHTGDRGRAGLLGLIWFAFPMSMFPFAEQHVSSALTGMLNSATPVFVTIVAAGLARRRPDTPVLGALAVGIVGAFLIAAPGLGEGGSTAWGIGLILAALASYGFAFNLAGPLQQRNGAAPVIWRALGVAVVVTAPLGVPALLDASWDWRSGLSMLALGGLGTGVANILVATAAGRGGAVRASAMAFIIPTVSLVLGVGLRDEHVAAVSLAGGALCVLGAWWLAVAARR